MIKFLTQPALSLIGLALISILLAMGEALKLPVVVMFILGGLIGFIDGFIMKSANKS